MKTIRIVGVPEHFNLPWHMAIEEGAFRERGIELVWRDIPEGTGRMCQLLENKETDLAIILTEGLVKSITEGNNSKIIQEYIATPLQWGIHVGAQSKYRYTSDLEGARAAISRFGSGSHLMSYVHAQSQGWNLDSLKFKVINDLDGAVKALTNDEANYFMWEHFTTKPLVDSGVFRRLDDCPTPWPCFVIAGTSAFLDRNHGVLRHILEIINTYTIEFKNIPSINKTLSNRYNQKLEDIDEWLSITQWSQNQIEESKIRLVNQTLIDLKRIDKGLEYSAIVI
jgi:ABC-type nitrate/sulfonate/bicarbonate transport system substrate-binding protein